MSNPTHDHGLDVKNIFITLKILILFFCVVAQRFQIFVRQPHFGDHVVHGLDVQLAGAFKAQTLVLGLAVFYFGNEYHGNVLAAAGAKSRLHLLPPKKLRIDLPDSHKSCGNKVKHL